MAEPDEEFAELPLDSTGTRLRRAREAAGLSLADISAQTKIAERHLASIEAGNLGALASRAYAVGFTRSYARAVGLDEHEIGAAVRNELDGLDSSHDRHTPLPFEPGDPARVPGPKLAWIAALAALALVVALFFVWRSFVSPAGSLPDLTADASASPEAVAASQAPAPSAQGAVVFTAQAQGIWVKFYDASGAQLMQKEMALGESYTVPAEANGPMIWTARPDALQVSVGGRVLPKLADKQVTMKDVPVTAAALLARPPAGAPPVPVAPASLPGVASPSAAPTQARAVTSRPAAPAPSPAAQAKQTQQAVVQPLPASPAAAPDPAGAAAAVPAAAAPSPQSSTVSQ